MYLYEDFGLKNRKNKDLLFGELITIIANE